MIPSTVARGLQRTATLLLKLGLMRNPPNFPATILPLPFDSH
jgi:hypothetical protein